MWCTKCHYGSEMCILHHLQKYNEWNTEKKKEVTIYKGKCPQCGNDTWVERNPFPTKPLRTLRDTRKNKEKKENKEVSDSGDRAEIERITGSLKGRDYSDGM